MKSLSQPSFFRVFDLLLGAANPGLKRSSWTHDGAGWERERHSFSGINHGLTIEIVTITRPGKRGWSVKVVKEYWWGGVDNKPLKMLRWAKPISGQRAYILQWFRDQEATLTPRSTSSRSVSLETSNLEGEIERVSEIDES
jgi:hypothetical protein